MCPSQIFWENMVNGEWIGGVFILALTILAAMFGSLHYSLAGVG